MLLLELNWLIMLHNLLLIFLTVSYFCVFSYILLCFYFSFFYVYYSTLISVNFPLLTFFFFFNTTSKATLHDFYNI